MTIEDEKHEDADEKEEDLEAIAATAIEGEEKTHVEPEAIVSSHPASAATSKQGDFSSLSPRLFPEP
eukprot:scaffold39176_cov260-Amphora_coffeaeformis.AAC.1